MRFRLLVAVLLVGGSSLLSGASVPASAQGYDAYALEARVWLDRGAEPVLQRGERVRLYYRVSDNAFVAIFHIDTNGSVRMVFPSSPQENHYARGGRDYRVLFPGSSYWYVSDDPGVGYYFIVASPEPFDFRQFGYSHFAGGWDLGQVGRQVYGDPYLAMDDYVATLIPDWEYVGYGLDFTSYSVERHYDYPRFMCYDCHGFQPYYTWNPYAYSCTSFRVVIYNDPYYYPATRYRGTRVVYVQPRRGVAHFGFKERAAGEPGTPQVVVRTPPASERPGVEGTENRRAVPRSGTPSVGNPPGSTGTSPGTRGTAPPGVESTGTRRTGTTSGTVGTPSSLRTNGRQPGTGLPSTTRPGAERPDPATTRVPVTSGRPTLERRPQGSGTGAAKPPTRPPGGGAVPRPSSRVIKPGGGGSGNPAARSGGTPPSRTNPTVRSGGSTTRTNPTVGRGSALPRTSPTARGSTSRTNPVVRTPARTKPTVKRPGSGGSNPPRTAKPPTRTKPRKPPGSGGGGGGGGGV